MRISKIDFILNINLSPKYSNKINNQYFLKCSCRITNLLLSSFFLSALAIKPHAFLKTKGCIPLRIQSPLPKFLPKRKNKKKMSVLSIWLSQGSKGKRSTCPRWALLLASITQLFPTKLNWIGISSKYIIKKIKIGKVGFGLRRQWEKHNH